jgi:hypothetical protein
MEYMKHNSPKKNTNPIVKILNIQDSNLSHFVVLLQ